MSNSAVVSAPNRLQPLRSRPGARQRHGAGQVARGVAARVLRLVLLCGAALRCAALNGQCAAS